MQLLNNEKSNQKGAIFIPFLIVAGISALLGAVGWFLKLDLAERISYAFFILLFSTLASISATFASFTSWILQLVISPDFTPLSYTQPDKNPIIDAGLSVTQGLANMILVLVLVFIALATILRLAGYETKKLILTFVLVALLVNFAPVLVGLVVDAANIVMNFFLNDLFQFGVISVEVSNLVDGLKSLFTGSIEEVRSAFFYAVTITIFSFFVAIVYLIYALIFMARYVAIWILTILAPLAFVFYILPATRGLARKWWQQLIQWAFIGVPTAFFLYLASHAAAGARNWFNVNVSGSNQLGPLAIIVVYLVPLLFLYLGLIFGLATSAMGASKIIEVSRRAQKWGATKGLVTARVGYGRLISSTTAERLKLKEKLQRQATARFMPERLRQKEKPVWKAAKVGYYAMAPFTAPIWAIRRGVGEITLRTTEAEKADIIKAEDKYKGAPVERKAAVIKDLGLNRSARIAALRMAIEEGEIGDLKKLGVSEDEIIKIGKSALQVHPEMFKKIRDAFPHLARRMGEGLSDTLKEIGGLKFKSNEEAKKFGNQIEAKIMAGMGTDQIGKMDWEAAFNYVNEAGVRVIENAFHHFASPEQLKTALRKFGKDFADRFSSRGKELGGLAWYNANNKPLAKYLGSTPARDLGVGFEQKEIEEGGPTLSDQFGRPIR